MASILLRTKSEAGYSTKNQPLTNLEIDENFIALNEELATKAPIASPTFTGTPAAPTAPVSANSTQIATTEFVQGVVAAANSVRISGNQTIDGTKTFSQPIVGNLNGNIASATATATTQDVEDSSARIATTEFVKLALATMYPVGSIYTNAAVATNPATLLGFGTWAAFGSGRVLVGVDAADSTFNTLGKTGGSKNAIVVSHSHSISITTGNESQGHTHGFSANTGTESQGHTHAYSGNTGGHSNDHSHHFSANTSNVGNHSHGNGAAGSSTSRSNLTPGSTPYYFTTLNSGNTSGAGSHNHSVSGNTGGVNNNHTHAYSGTTGNISANHTHAVSGTTGAVSANHTHAVTGSTATVGSDGTNANLQPYVTVYMWRRTA